MTNESNLEKVVNFVDEFRKAKENEKFERTYNSLQSQENGRGYLFANLIKRFYEIGRTNGKPILNNSGVYRAANTYLNQRGSEE